MTEEDKLKITKAIFSKDMEVNFPCIICDTKITVPLSTAHKHSRICEECKQAILYAKELLKKDMKSERGGDATW